MDYRKQTGIMLDVGCRDRKQTNFVGIDQRDYPGVDIIHNLEYFPYPIDDEACLTIKCAHVIEHIEPRKTIDFMDELWRMLKPDGQLAISAPYARSPGYMQDPTHCTMITEMTFNYFTPASPLYQQYRPKPWVMEHLAYKPDGNIEAVLRKMIVDDEVVTLTTEALAKGAIQKPQELHDLLAFLKQHRPLKTVVEIGTANGGVFYALCKLADDTATLVSMDLEFGQFGTGQKLPEIKSLTKYGGKRQTLHFIRGDSHKPEAKKKLTSILGSRQIDVLFIDGDHTYNGVKKDWQMYAPLVRKGGLVVFHDICYHPQALICEVERFWQELKPTHTVREFVYPETTWGGIGVVTV